MNRHLIRSGCLLVLTLSALCSCRSNGSPDGGGELSREAVTNIAAGSATGSALSGTYNVELRTTACSGTCAVNVGGFVQSICDVGDTNAETARVTQTDGVLEIRMNDTPSLYRGGVDLDGQFDLGAYETENGNTYEIFVRADGVITDQQINGMARSRSVGVVGNSPIDCYGEYTITGPRNAS